MNKLRLILLIIIGLTLTGCTQEGFVKTDDCREHITVKKGDLDTLIHTYTGYSDSKDGKIYALYSRVELDNNGTCLKEYTYTIGN